MGKCMSVFVSFCLWLYVSVYLFIFGSFLFLLFLNQNDNECRLIILMRKVIFAQKRTKNTSEVIHFRERASVISGNLLNDSHTDNVGMMKRRWRRRWRRRRQRRRRRLAALLTGSITRTHSYSFTDNRKPFTFCFYENYKIESTKIPVISLGNLVISCGWFLHNDPKWMAKWNGSIWKWSFAGKSNEWLFDGDWMRMRLLAKDSIGNGDTSSFATNIVMAVRCEATSCSTTQNLVSFRHFHKEQEQHFLQETAWTAICNDLEIAIVKYHSETATIDNPKIFAPNADDTFETGTVTDNDSERFRKSHGMDANSMILTGCYPTEVKSFVWAAYDLNGNQNAVIIKHQLQCHCAMHRMWQHEWEIARQPLRANKCVMINI